MVVPAPGAKLALVANVPATVPPSVTGSIPVAPYMIWLDRKLNGLPLTYVWIADTRQLPKIAFTILGPSFKSFLPRPKGSS